MLDKLRVTLEEPNALEQSTKQQSSSTKWKASRVGRVMTSHFGDVLLRRSLPTDRFINFFKKKGLCFPSSAVEPWIYITTRQKLVTFTLLTQDFLYTFVD